MVNGSETPGPLLETLREAQRLGFFGAAPMEMAIRHARSFLDAIGEQAPGSRIVDIGSGGGLPGLVIASSLPHVDVTLIDRRQKRTDFLERARRRLELLNVSIWCCDVADVARDVDAGQLAGWDVVTARGFGPPATTLRLAVRLLVVGAGTIVISEPPTGDRWDPRLLEELGLEGEPRGRVRRFRRLKSH